MEFFGITLYGFPDPIKNMIRSDYAEPSIPPNNMELIEKGRKLKFSNIIKEIDCYIGNIDGFAYRSHDRFKRMKKKGVIKCLGPGDMYNYPGVNSMNFGWWMNDITDESNWYLPQKRNPKPSTELSKYVNACRKIEKNFKL